MEKEDAKDLVELCIHYAKETRNALIAVSAQLPTKDGGGGAEIEDEIEEIWADIENLIRLKNEL